MRQVILNEAELAFCRDMANRREDAAIGYALQWGLDPFPHHPNIQFGTPSGDLQIEAEKKIHFQGVAGELAFCKAFDIYYPNRLREARYNWDADDAVWSGDPKEADVSHDVEVRSVSSHAGFVCIKEKDNPSFNVAVIRRLKEDCSLMSCRRNHWSPSSVRVESTIRAATCLEQIGSIMTEKASG
jgi:hypothetical protein